MTRHGTWLGLSALLAALVAGPARADDVELQSESLKDEVKTLKRELATLKRMLAADRQAADLEMRLVNARLRRIEQALARLAPDTSARVSALYTPSTPAPATGVVRLS